MCLYAHAIPPKKPSKPQNTAMQTNANSSKMAGYDTNALSLNARPVYIFDLIGGPGRDRTDDLFHAMEARSQTAPQAHWLQGCNFSIVSVGAGFVKLCLFKAWKAAPWHGSRFIKESKTCVTGNTLGVLRCLT